MCDNLNGRYKCSYIPRHNGYHELDVILRSSTSQPGGLGLLGTYFNSPLDIESLHDDDAFASSTYTQIDKKVSFSWPTGVILPVSSALVDNNDVNVTGTVANGYDSRSVGMDDNLQAAVRPSGQSVIWTGFISPPRSDIYQFKLRTVGMTGSIYIDDVLVFDSEDDFYDSVEFYSQAAYKINVKASVMYAASSSPVSIDLMWKVPVNKWTIISSFFCMIQQKLARNPFPVVVGGNWTTVSLPSSLPSSAPSSQPSGQPSSRPSGQPSAMPSSEPVLSLHSQVEQVHSKLPGHQSMITWRRNSGNPAI